MQIQFSSKTFELTDSIKEFLQKKISKLQKFSKHGLNSVQVVIDRVKRGKKTTSDAEVEVIAQVKGKRFAFREVGENLYKAVYRVIEKVENKMGKMPEKKGKIKISHKEK